MAKDDIRIPKEITEYIEKGKQAFRKHNYDYAIELFNYALALDKKLTEARHYLHLTKIKKFQEKPLSLFSKGTNKIKAQTHVLNAKKLKNNGMLDKAIEEYEKALSLDALNSKIFINLALLFLNLNMRDSSIKTFEEILNINPDNMETLKRLGELFKDKKEYEKSQNYYLKAQQVSPLDLDVQKGLKDLAALQAIDKGGWKDQETFRTKIQDKEEAKKLEKETKSSRTEEDINYLIENLKEKLAKEPENLPLLFRLGDYYKEINLHDKAEEAYKLILKIKPESDIAQKNIEQLQVKKIEKDLSLLEEKLKKDPANQELKKNVDELNKKKENIYFEKTKEKVSRLPNDSKLRYQYGVLLKEKGMLNEAISQFQECVKDPLVRLDSLNMLGLSFKEKAMFDLAVTQFRKAITLAPEITEKTKDIIYNLGVTYEKMEQLTEAANEFKKIYEVDINYKDVAQKIEKTYRDE